MCVCIRYSTSIIEKVFHYEENEISDIKCNDEIWFQGKSVAQSLGYLKPLKTLHTHVDKEDKRKLSDQSSDILQHSQNRPTGDRW